MLVLWICDAGGPIFALNYFMPKYNHCFSHQNKLANNNSNNYINSNIRIKLQTSLVMVIDKKSNLSKWVSVFLFFIKSFIVNFP